MKSRTATLLSVLFVFVFFCIMSTTASSAATCPGGGCTDDSNSNSNSNSNVPSKMTVSELLAKPPEAIVEILGGIYEHSPWVAEAFVAKELGGGNSGSGSGSDGDISTVTQLASALKSHVDNAPDDEKLALLSAHPDLCQKVEALQKLTKDSQEEQSRSGLQSMVGAELDRFKKMNKTYKDRHGFPFILAVRNASKSTVLNALEGRLNHSSPQKEFHVALEQVHKIAWMRLLAKVESDEAKGFLTCHVLDTANGIPAQNMKIVLTRLTPEESAGVVGEFVTNNDGRLEGGPALKGGDFVVGTYQWDFYAGDYFAGRGNAMNGNPFLDVIPLRFGIDNPDDHYHVPLLVSPWGYSTYRGS